MWAHNQYYLPDDTWNPVSYNYLTNGIQDDKQVACFEANIESDYNLTLVNQQCNYSWKEGYFGVDWEDWDTYMDRRGFSAQIYYKYTYDASSKTWVHVYDKLTLIENIIIWIFKL